MTAQMPSPEQLAEADIKNSPFFKRMIEGVGEENAKRAPSRSEVWLQVAMLLNTIHEMRQEIAELKARPAFKYCGVYQAGKAYTKGNFVTDGGSMWHAERATMARPGADESWVLAVKRGRGVKP